MSIKPSFYKNQLNVTRGFLKFQCDALIYTPIA